MKLKSLRERIAGSTDNEEFVRKIEEMEERASEMLLETAGPDHTPADAFDADLTDEQQMHLNAVCVRGVSRTIH